MLVVVKRWMLACNCDRGRAGSGGFLYSRQPSWCTAIHSRYTDPFHCNAITGVML